MKPRGIRRMLLLAIPLAMVALAATWLAAGPLDLDHEPQVEAGPPGLQQADTSPGDVPADWTYEQVYDDWPEQPRDKVLYVGYNTGDDKPVAAQLQCPCGCGLRMRISLREQDDPHWVFSAVDGKPTLAPSVWWNSGCESHFILSAGRIYFIPPQPLN
jgi:hypothetical protein